MSHLLESRIDLDFCNSQSTDEPYQSPKSVQGQSQTLEDLIQQNEDISSKLRSQLRKTAQFEEATLELNTKLLNLTNQHHLLEEQLLIMRQKEQALNEKIQSAAHTVKQNEQLKSIIQDQNAAIQRHLRYQEKIKNQIKPYIKQLKEVATASHAEVTRLVDTLNQKEIQITKLTQHLEAIKSDVTQLSTQHTAQLEHLKAHFESEKQKLNHRIEELNLTNQELQKKAHLVDIAHFRQNELENQLIAEKAKHQKSIEDHRLENSRLLSEITKIQPENTTLRQDKQNLNTKLETTQANLLQSQSQAITLEKQLQVLREQWTDKSSECDKLRLQIKSLESLNQDLTHRLNLARKGQASL